MLRLGPEAFHKSRTDKLDVQLDEVLEETFSTSDLFMQATRGGAKT